MKPKKLSDKLNLFDQYLHALVKRFYLRPTLDGAGQELSASELFACRTLGRKGTCTMTELAKECNLVMSSATGVVDRLVDRGYVKRTRNDEEDRRKVFVELDRKGEKIYQELLESEMETIITVMDALKPAEQDALLHALGKAVGAWEK
ncbi:MAG: MarR family transcriptional regulator [Deltaproteobacteria bacterium]|nr:MarR family transcriptional regulator [Deltaproteobacteria bacterium]